MLRYTTIIFDLDGTLLNTLADLTTSVNHALHAHGYPQRTQEEIRLFVGNGIGLLIRRALPPDADDGQHAAVLATFTAYYALHNAHQTRPYEGVPAMLEALRAMGVQLAIVSNKNDDNVKALADAYFGISVAIGERGGAQRKPAPDSVFEAMDALRADSRHTLYVGDSEVDLQTAHNAGLACLAVTWGFRNEEDLKQQGAEHFAHTPEEVIAFVNRVDSF